MAIAEAAGIAAEPRALDGRGRAALDAARRGAAGEGEERRRCQETSPETNPGGGAGPAQGRPSMRRSIGDRVGFRTLSGTLERSLSCWNRRLVAVP